MNVRLLVLLLCIGVSTGCAQFARDVITPEVYLAGIEPLESGLLDQRMRVDLNVVNPNEYGVTVSSIDFVLEVNDSRLVSGFSSDSVTIPGRQERVVSVIARTGVFQVARQLMKLPGAETLTYELSGDMKLGRFAGKSFPFDFQGEISRESLFGAAGGG